MRLLRRLESQPDPAPDLHAEFVAAWERLEIHAHTIFAVDGADPYATEALLRWRRNPSELWAADMILPVAEETDRLLACLTWATELSLRTWAASGIREGGGRLAINLHGTQLSQPDMADTVGDLLERTEVEAAELIIEIPDHIGVDACRAAITELQPILAGGAQLALDHHHGIGASPAPLADWLPEHSLVKLDAALLMAADEPVGAEILSDITNDLNEQGYVIVAEGIERLSQLRAAVDCGIRWVQGSLFERPAPLT